MTRLLNSDDTIEHAPTTLSADMLATVTGGDGDGILFETPGRITSLGGGNASPVFVSGFQKKPPQPSSILNLDAAAAKILNVTGNQVQGFRQFLEDPFTHPGTQTPRNPGDPAP